MMTSDPEEQPTPSPLPAQRTNVLIGPLGLRAGWGIALFIVLAGALWFGIGFATVHLSGQQAAIRALRQQARQEAREAKAQHTAPPVQELPLPLVSINEGVTASATLLAAGVLAYLERRRFGVYGLLRQRLRDLLPGALWGLICMSALVGVLRMLHLLVFDRRLLAGGAVLRFGAGWLLVFFLVGLSEEFLFRGYIQFTLMRGLLGLARRVFPNRLRQAAFWMSAVFWSLLFAAGHFTNAGENPLGLVQVFFAGVLFAYALWRTGSLWWGIGFHMTWDWAQSFLFGTADSGTLSAGRLFQTHAAGAPLLSGGVDGPEGSVFCVGALLLAFLVLRLRPQQAQPPVEPEWAGGVV